MRPLRLRLKGFTSFRDEQEIDFSTLDLFAIAGPTGAGKSSLLDAMTYALYGCVERVGGECAQLISQGLPSMAVTLEFDVSGERWRVTRRTYRKAATETVLEHFVDGAWKPEAGKVRDVNERIGELIGLDYDGFTRAVLLPQGKFDQFLAGDAKDRREFLQRQLGTDFAGVDDAALSAERERIVSLRDREKHLVAVRKRVQQIVERRHAALGAVDALRGCATEAREHAAVANGVTRALTRLAADVARAERDAAAATKRAEEATRSAEAALAKLSAARERFGSSKDLRELERKADRYVAARDEVERLAKAIAEAEAAVPKLRERVAAQTQSLKTARAAETRDRDTRVAARKAYESAQHDSALAAIAGGLRKGDRCPICGNVLAATPKIAPSATLEKAKSALERAESASDASRDAVRDAEDALREAEREQKGLAEQLAGARKASAERGRVIREAEDALRAVLGTKLDDPVATIRDRIAEFDALDEALRKADSTASRARELAALSRAERTTALASLESEKARI